MKKYISLILALVLAFSLTACGGDEGAGSSVPEDSSLEAISSNPQAVNAEKLERSAELLSEHFVTWAMYPNTLENLASVTDDMIRDFIFTIAMYRDEPAHPYASIITVGDNHRYRWPQADVERVAFELFGRERWDFGNTINSIDFLFDEATGEYHSGLEFGIGRYVFIFESADATYLADEGRVKVTLQLRTLIPDVMDPTFTEDATEYTAFFTVLGEGEETFLRLQSVMPA